MFFRLTEFHDPWVLCLWPLVLALFVWRVTRRRSIAAIAFPSVERVKGLRPTMRQRLRVLVPILEGAALTGLVLAAARPREGDARSIVRSQGLAIQMVLDRSGSMREPMRFAGSDTRKIDIVRDIFRRFVAGGGGLPGRKTDLIGLTTFARFTEENCPLVSTYEPLLTTVSALDAVLPFVDKFGVATDDPSNPRERGLQYSPLDRTAIGDGLKRAVLSLVAAEEDLSRGDDETAYKIQGKVIILLTDGMNNAGDVDPAEAGQYAAANGIRVYYVLVHPTTVAQETPFGQRIERELDPAKLLEVPLEVVKPSGGRAFLATSGDELLRVYEEIDRMEKSAVGKIEFTTYEEKYRWFLVPAFALAAAAFVLKETVFRSLP